MQVVGLACFKALSADGISFAIPIDVAKDVMTQLKVGSFEVQVVTQQSNIHSFASVGHAAVSTGLGCNFATVLCCQGYGRHGTETLAGKLTLSPC